MSKLSFLLCLILATIFVVVVNGSESEVGIYELKKGDFSLKVTNFGARIISLVLPDKNGKPTDVVLGYDSVKEYLNDTQYFGAIVGRVVNRIGGAQFTLNGVHYKLDANEKPNMLHGGRKGFSLLTWKVEKYVKDKANPFIVLSYYSPDGEEGFPGNLLVRVTYALLEPYKLSVIMEAEALNKATPVNLAQHSYWNLGGHNSGDVLSDKVQIFGLHYTPANKQLIPTGEILPVKGTPYDFLKPHKIQSQMKGLPSGGTPSGYNVNYALDEGKDHKLKLAAIAYSKKTGIGMMISTSAPGLQFYTANYLNVTGKGGYVYQSHAAYCFETQGFPDAVNHPNFPSTIVNPGDLYVHNMLVEFKIKQK
ncbi:aldose 1-epimerase-like [Coffea eugenioides]|uniref:aldose 1-epimerase-like n=1 Tax=Coffea eugenioides TaxID=49369 RepID=UPI000F5CBFB9|nr:aldose 1-epimerase-like [Coffea arabica]XP_027162728.1 aldose 1-epimerase-like [Coffea eugenioides]